MKLMEREYLIEQTHNHIEYPKKEATSMQITLIYNTTHTSRLDRCTQTKHEGC